MTLAIGQEAPDFRLVGTARETVGITSFTPDKNVVLAFYELAFNDDDVEELQAFQDLVPEFEAANAQVMAVSIDPVGIIQGFAGSFGFSFILLGDSVKHEVAAKYEAWSAKRGFASEDGGINARVTYVIDQKGIVRGVIKDVADVSDHAAEALRILKEIGAPV